MRCATNWHVTAGNEERREGTERESQKSISERETHLTALCLGLPGCAGTRKVKPIWILLKQDTVSGSGIS